MKNKNTWDLLLTPNSERSTRNFILQEFLTVDANAHLEKLAAHMFPSPALLPVELVRSALKRRAAAVSLEVHSERMVISDNGDGITSPEWQALACVGDMRQTAVARERALACIQNLAAPGIGLLAVFFPGARSLQIENSGPAGKSTLRIADGQIELKNTCSWTQGTRITISRRRGPAAKEIKLLTELCAAVQAEIVINGRQLKKKPLLPHSMASVNILFGKSSTRSSLAIPARGDVCRIWLLDQGIPWQVTAMAPFQGLIFSAALETPHQLSPPTFDILAAAANRLYQWLAEHYVQFPEPYQFRCEDLFFRQARSGDDHGLLSICAPFRLWRSPQRLNLAEVRRKAENGVLNFMDYGSQLNQCSGPERDVLSCEDRPISSATIGGRSVLPCEDRPISSATIGGRSVLLLTPRQKDFLLNYLRLPMVSLNAPLSTSVKPRKILAFCRQKFAGLLGFQPIPKAEILDNRRLSSAECTLCRELEIHWRRELEKAEPGAAALPLSVVMIAGRGLVPAFWLKNERGSTLQIRRRHPLTLRVLQSIQQDRDNGELAFAALMPGHFLTVRDP